VRIFGSSEATIATIGNDQHRMRRSPMNRFFSKEMVRRLEPILQEKLTKLLSKLRAYKGVGQPLNLNLPFSAFTNDVIAEYCFAKPYNYLDSPNFNDKFFEMMVTVHEMAPIAKQFPFIMPMMDAVPD
jgi:cytochrome P450